MVVSSSRSRRPRAGRLLRVGTRGSQMSAQLSPCTWNAGTPVPHQRRPRPPWVRVWTATLVPARVRLSDCWTETLVARCPERGLCPQASPCGSCRQTATVCPTACCPRRWSGTITTPATSNRTKYPNINTTELQCTPNSTGCNPDRF